MKPIFCIIGKSGSGKSTILDYITNKNYNNEAEDLSLKKLIYHTTRTPRENEEQGVDYYFEKSCNSIEEFNELHKDDNIIEKRVYEKADELAIYYTLEDDIDNDDDILICAASVNQALEYYNKLDKVYIICIDTISEKERIMRLIKRANTDMECVELCRRITEETKEFNKFNLFDDDKILHILNEDIDAGKESIAWFDSLDKISCKIYDFIEDKITYN